MFFETTNRTTPGTIVNYARPRRPDQVTRQNPARPQPVINRPTAFPKAGSRGITGTVGRNNAVRTSPRSRFSPGARFAPGYPPQPATVPLARAINSSSTSTGWPGRQPGTSPQTFSGQQGRSTNNLNQRKPGMSPQQRSQVIINKLRRRPGRQASFNQLMPRTPAHRVSGHGHSGYSQGPARHNNFVRPTIPGSYTPHLPTGFFTRGGRPGHPGITGPSSCSCANCNAYPPKLCASCGSSTAGCSSIARFSLNRHKLKEHHRQQIASIAEKILQNKINIVVATGHTDKMGSEENNDKLGYLRAVTVVREIRQQLALKLANSHRRVYWRIDSKGETEPIANSNPENNRRVEICMKKAYL